MRLADRHQTRRTYQVAAFFSATLVIGQLYAMGATQEVDRFWVPLALALVAMATWAAGRMWKPGDRTGRAIGVRGLCVVAFTMFFGGMLTTLTFIINGGLSRTPPLREEWLSLAFASEAAFWTFIGGFVVLLQGSLVLGFTPWLLGFFVSRFFRNDTPKPRDYE